MNEEVAKSWMKKVVETAANRDYVAHMNLISKKVNITGIPGFDSVGYEDWAKQCQHEFEDKIIKSVNYQGLKMCAATDTQVMFNTYEVVEATDGKVNAQGIEVLLENEEGTWRVVQERILSAAEVEHYKLLD